MHISHIAVAAGLASATSLIPTTLSVVTPAPQSTILDPVPQPPSTLLSVSTYLPPPPAYMSIRTVTRSIPATKTVHLKPSKTTTYPGCGGFRPTPAPCPEGNICIDDPWGIGCGMACDKPGICVPQIQCGGFIGAQCPKGMWCIDDPRDDCDPLKGGADCMGLCV